MTCPVHHFPLKDANGCWQCYDEKRMAGKLAEKENKPKRIYQIAPISKKKMQRESKLSKVRSEKKRAITWCQSCKSPEGPLDYSHILSVKHYPQYEAHPLNAVIECRKCHEVWENGTYEEKVQQRSWQYKMTVIQFLEPGHLHKMQLKSDSNNN